MSINLSLINNMVDNLSAHPWTTETPKVIFRGPIPPGNLSWPCIAVFATVGNEGDIAGLGYAKVRESFNWTLATHLGLESVEAVYVAHTLWRDEARTLMRRSIDGYWGLGGIVTMTNIEPVWESGFFEVGTEAESVGHIVATTIKTEVEYREQF